MVSSPTQNAPIRKGIMNCQTEMPAARAMTSSRRRFRAISTVMPTKSAMNGTVCCRMNGSLTAVISRPMETV